MQQKNEQSKRAALIAAGYAPKPVDPMLKARPSYAPPAAKQVRR